MQLAWDKTGQRFFEAGLDMGVLYPNGSPAVAWNGLISIERNVSGGETEAYYIDGIKYFDNVANEDFQATLSAFTYPDEFSPCLGLAKTAGGLTLSRQPRQTFGLAWRTKVGNDLDGIEHSSKIHIVYGATAAPSSKSNQTISDSPTPVSFEWTINAIPVIPGMGLGGSYGGDPNVDFLDWMWPPGFGMPGWPMGPDGNTPVPGWKATPYIVIEEKDVTPDVFDDIIDRLNGTPETLPYLPSPLDMINLLSGNLDSVPPAPLDPDYVPPVDPGDGGGNTGGWGGPYAMGPVITEVYQGSLEDYPNDTIIPYGPPHLNDADDSTNIIVSPSWAGDWFLYYDTSKMNFDESGFTFKFRVNSGEIQPQKLQLQLFDAESTFDATKRFNINLPPGANDVWGVEDWYLDLADGFTDYEFSITPKWVEDNWDGNMTYPQRVITPWLATHQDPSGPVTHFTYAEFVAAIKSRPWFVAHFRWNHPQGIPMLYDSAIQVIEAVVDLAPVPHEASEYAYQEATNYNLANGDGDAQLEPPPWSPQPFYKKWVTLGSDFSQSFWEKADGFRIRISAPASAGQKVEISSELDADRDYQSFYGQVTIPTEGDAFLYLDQSSLNYSSWDIPYSKEEAITRLSYVPPTLDMQSKCTIQVRPLSTNTKTVNVEKFVLEAWTYK